jgi:hypothetical protein
MIERPIGYVALGAPFAAAAVELVPDFPGGQVAVAAAAAVALAIGVLTFLQPETFGLPNVTVLAALLAIASVATLDPGLIGPYGPAVFVGALIGAPWILVGYVARSDAPVGGQFVVYALAVIWGLFLLANAPSAAGTGVSAIASAYVAHFFSLLGAQFQVFGGLLTGAASPPLPLNQFFDPTYSAFVALSIGGLLLVTVRPQTGSRSPLPVAVRAYRGIDSDRELTGTYGFTPAQRQVFRDRTSAEAPLATWPPGLEPVFYGAAAAGAFLLAAYFVPTWTVPAAVAAAGIAAAWLVRTTERPAALPAPRVPPPTAGADAPEEPTGPIESPGGEGHPPAPAQAP